MTFSRMTLGTVQFGLNYGIANRTGQPSIEHVRDILRQAAFEGINTLDTAAAYGQSESVLGEVLADSELHDRFEIVTKTPPIPTDLSDSAAYDFIRNHLDESLRRLRRDKVAILLLHREDDIRFLPVMKRLQEEGRVGGIGVSLDSDRFLTEALQAQYIQLPFNLLDRRFNRFLADAKERNITVFARSAFLQGLLLMPEEEIPTTLAELIPFRQRLMALAEANGYEFKTFCIQYVLACPGIQSLVFGVDRVEQLRENMCAFKERPLSAALFDEASQLVPLLEDRLIRPACWKRS